LQLLKNYENVRTEDIVQGKMTDRSGMCIQTDKKKCQALVKLSPEQTEKEGYGSLEENKTVMLNCHPFC